MALKQLNFRVEEELVGKLKYIAWFDRESITDVYVKSTTEYIGRWEKKNGPITDELLKKAQKK